jgi:hypothetical protein
MEAVDIIAVNLGNEMSFDVRNRMPKPKEAAWPCSSLVTTVQGSGQSEEIQLAHFSVKEYLTSDRVHPRYKAEFNRCSASACVASVSLVYLLHVDDNIDAQRTMMQFSFAEFAARCWMAQAREAQRMDLNVSALAVVLLCDDSRFAKWLDLFDPDDPRKPLARDTSRQMIPSPLCYASLEVFLHIVETLINRSFEVNEQRGKYDSTL